MDHSTIDVGERKKQFFQRIKAETSDLHRQTENSRLSVALMGLQLSKKDYAEYLSRMKDIVEYFEKHFFNELTHIIPDIEQRRKLNAIQDDLAYLNAEPKQNRFSLPPAVTIAHLLGYMYVLEGSTLGGALIYKHVSKHVDISEEKGGAYFTCYRSELSVKWKSFLDILGRLCLV
jgi:heme oxygenase (biliverdin-IX-beta and delta-forming)